MAFVPLLAVLLRTGRHQRLLPGYLPSVLSAFASQNGLSEQWAASTLSRIEDCANAVRQRFDGMSTDEREDVRTQITTTGGLTLHLIDLPSFSDLRTPFPLPSEPLPPVKFPPFPDI